VTVTLQPLAGEDVPIVLSQLIPAIGPQASEVRLFENLEAKAGVVYNLTAVATMEGDGDTTDDNSFTLVFERNAE